MTEEQIIACVEDAMKEIRESDAFDPDEATLPSRREYLNRLINAIAIELDALPDEDDEG